MSCVVSYPSCKTGFSLSRQTCTKPLTKSRHDNHHRYFVSENPYYLAATLNKTPALCEVTSPFEGNYQDCQYCLDTEGPIPVLTMSEGGRGNRGSRGSTSVAEFLDLLQPYIDYCNELQWGSDAVSPSLPSITPSQPISEFPTVVTSLRMTTAPPADLTSSISSSMILPIESPPTLVVIDPGDPTHSASNITAMPSPTSSTVNGAVATIPTGTMVAVSMGVIIGLLLLAVVWLLFHFRHNAHRKRNPPQVLGDGEPRADRDGDAMSVREQPQELNPTCPQTRAEVEGDRPACWELDSHRHYAELDGGFLTN